jgi:hypothetical protein
VFYQIRGAWERSQERSTHNAAKAAKKKEKRDQPRAGREISEDDQWAKLRLVVETAREVWGE